MTAEATVTRVSANGRVEVEFGPPARCRGCEGTCLWRRLPGAAPHFDTPLALAVGEPVLVALPDRYLLLGALLVHGLPLAALLARRARGRRRRRVGRGRRGRRGRSRSRPRCSSRRGCAAGSSAERCGGVELRPERVRHAAHSFFIAGRSAIFASSSRRSCCR